MCISEQIIVKQSDTRHCKIEKIHGNSYDLCYVRLSNPEPKRWQTCPARVLWNGCPNGVFGKPRAQGTWSPRRKLLQNGDHPKWNLSGCWNIIIYTILDPSHTGDNMRQHIKYMRQLYMSEIIRLQGCWKPFCWKAAFFCCWWKKGKSLEDSRTVQSWPRKDGIDGQALRDGVADLSAMVRVSCAAHVVWIWENHGASTWLLGYDAYVMLMWCLCWHHGITFGASS